MSAGESGEVDLDWIRRRIVELDDMQRALPPESIAERHALLEATDDLRTVLRSGHAAALEHVRARWEERASRKGEHDADPAVLASIVRGMMPSR